MPKFKGRPTGGDDFSDDPASSEAGVVGGVSRVSPSRDSLPPPTTTCKLGSKGPRETSGTEWDVPVMPGLQKSARAVLQEIIKTQDVVFY